MLFTKHPRDQQSSSKTVQIKMIKFEKIRQIEICFFLETQKIINIIPMVF